MSSNDYDDPKLEAEWLSEHRTNVQRYLRDQGVEHGGVASEPEWFLAPYVSIWRIGQMMTRCGRGRWPNDPLQRLEGLGNPREVGKRSRFIAKENFGFDSAEQARKECSPWIWPGKRAESFR